MYDAIIFDKDGVLVSHSGRALFDRVARDAFADLGVPNPSPEAIATISKVPTEAVNSDFADIESEYAVDPAELLLRRDERAVQHQRAAAETGAKEPYADVVALESLDVPLGVVSNNQQGTVEAILSVHGLADIFDTTYGRAHGLEGLRNRKPSPHYLEQAIEDLDAQDPLYVGDSGTDLLAAERAGVDSVFVRREHREGYELPTDPRFEVADLSELIREITP